MALLIIFILGLVVGSFLNVVIFRIHFQESFLFGRSHCSNCKKQLAWKDLVPLFSFLFLRGRCRYCRTKLSWQYPLVELTTAVAFTLFALNSQFSILNSQFWFQLVMACFLIVIAVYDAKHYLILDKVVFPALAIAVLYNFYISPRQGMLGLLMGFTIAGFFWLQYVFSSGKWIGMGDIKFGLLLGNIAIWPQGLALLMLAYVIGAIVGLILIGIGRKSLGSQLPFGLFLGFSAIIVMLFGDIITNWYLRLVGL